MFFPVTGVDDGMTDIPFRIDNCLVAYWLRGYWYSELKLARHRLILPPRYQTDEQRRGNLVLLPTSDS